MLHSVCLTGSNQCLHQKIQLHPIHRIFGARLLFAFVSYQTLFHRFLPAITNKRQHGTSKVKPQLRPRLCWVITKRAREIKGGACSPCTTSSSRPRGAGQGRRQRGPQGHPGASVGEGSSARARPVPAVSPSAAPARPERARPVPSQRSAPVRPERRSTAGVRVPLLPTAGCAGARVCPRVLEHMSLHRHVPAPVSPHPCTRVPTSQPRLPPSMPQPVRCPHPGDALLPQLPGGTCARTLRFALCSPSKRLLSKCPVSGGHKPTSRQDAAAPQATAAEVPAICLEKKRLFFIPGAIRQTPLHKGLKGDLFCRSRFRASARERVINIPALPSPRCCLSLWEAAKRERWERGTKDSLPKQKICYQNLAPR